MVLGVKTRLVLAGAMLGVSLLALKAADAQVDPAPGTPGMPQTMPGTPPPPGTSPTLPQPMLPGTDAGMGGSGVMQPPTFPSPFERDAGMGGFGDAGTGLGY